MNLTITGRQVTSPSGHKMNTRKNAYHPLSTTSFVDETLFGSNKLQDANFDPPWAEKKKQSRPLLFYTPSPSALDTSKTSISRTGTPRLRKFRHTPSFVDESLFGPTLKEADFLPPWDHDPPKRHLLWSPASVQGSQSARPGSRTRLTHNGAQTERSRFRVEQNGVNTARSGFQQDMCFTYERPASQNRSVTSRMSNRSANVSKPPWK